MYIVKKNIVYYINCQLRTHIFKLLICFFQFFTENYNKNVKYD